MFLFTKDVQNHKMLGNYFEFHKRGCSDDKANYHGKVAVRFFFLKVKNFKSFTTYNSRHNDKPPEHSGSEF